MSPTHDPSSDGSSTGRPDDGFTLIELLLTITILGVIMSSLVATMFVMLQTRRSTLEQLDVSHDAQNAASYFNNDVQGGTTLALAGPAGCGSTATALVTFASNDYVPTAGSVTPPSVLLTTSWLWVPDALPLAPGRVAGQGQLRRLSCRGTAAPSLGVLAHDLKQAPTVGSSCAGGGVASTSTAVISLTLVGSDNRSFVLCGRRRTR